MSAFRHQAAWMTFIDGSGALSPMEVTFRFFYQSCPGKAHSPVGVVCFPDTKPAAVQAGFNSSLDPGAAGGGKAYGKSRN
jgi:hypothetical protein